MVYVDSAMKFSRHRKPSVTPNPIESYHNLLLEYPSMLSYFECSYKVGHFIGRGGAHLRTLEHTLNACIYILHHKPRSVLR